MSSLLFPLCTFFLLCLCIAYWASTAVYPSLFLFSILILFFVLILIPASLLSKVQGLPKPWNVISSRIHLKSLRFNPKQLLGWESSSRRSFGEGEAEPALDLGFGFGVWIWALGNGLSLTRTRSFLSTSNEAVYKVFNESSCPFSGQTCKPEVRTWRKP